MLINQRNGLDLNIVMILKFLLNIRIISTIYMKTACSPYKNGKTLMVFDDMVVDMLENKKNSTNSNKIIY